MRKICNDVKWNQHQQHHNGYHRHHHQYYVHFHAHHIHHHTRRNVILKANKRILSLQFNYPITMSCDDLQKSSLVAFSSVGHKCHMYPNHAIYSLTMLRSFHSNYDLVVICFQLRRLPYSCINMTDMYLPFQIPNTQHPIPNT